MATRLSGVSGGDRAGERRLSTQLPKGNQAAGAPKLADYLFNGAVEVWEATEKLMDAKGQIISIKQISKTVRRGTPQWVIDRILGQPISDVEAIKILAESGWLKEQVMERLGAAMDKFNESAKAALQGDLDDEDLDAQSSG